MNRDFKGVWIPANIWLNERLSAIDKVLLAEIDSLSSTEDGCYASNGYFAKFCGCSVPTITRSIKKLIDLGLIQVVEFDGRHRRLTCVNNLFILPNQNDEAPSSKRLAINIDNKYKEETKEISKDISADAELISKKKNLYELCIDSINELFSDDEIKEALRDYLSVRITLGKMSAKSFRTIILALNDLADTKEEALQIIYTATVRGYMCFYKDTGKQEHYKKSVVMGNDDGILINRRKT